MDNNIAIDLSDIPEITNFSKAHKNPYAEKIKKQGFSVTVHYSADDVNKIIRDICDRDIDLLQLDAEEQKALERYKDANK